MLHVGGLVTQCHSAAARSVAYVGGTRCRSQRHQRAVVSVWDLAFAFSFTVNKGTYFANAMQGETLSSWQMSSVTPVHPTHKKLTPPLTVRDANQRNALLLTWSFWPRTGSVVHSYVRQLSPHLSVVCVCVCVCVCVSVCVLSSRLLFIVSVSAPAQRPSLRWLLVVAGIVWVTDHVLQSTPSPSKKEEPDFAV